MQIRLHNNLSLVECTYREYNLKYREAKWLQIDKMFALHEH